MKKFTAIALAVVMTLLSLNLTLPVFAVTTQVSGDAQALQNALSANENVTLTADVDLSAYDWTMVENYTGTLDGNGYTIYVPDAPLFYTSRKRLLNNL